MSDGHDVIKEIRAWQTRVVKQATELDSETMWTLRRELEQTLEHLTAIQVARILQKNPLPEELPNPQSLPVILTLQEAAELLKIGQATAYRMFGNGEIPGEVKFGGARRVHGPTLEQWLAEQAKKEPEPRLGKRDVIVEVRQPEKTYLLRNPTPRRGKK